MYSSELEQIVINRMNEPPTLSIPSQGTQQILRSDSPTPIPMDEQHYYRQAPMHNSTPISIGNNLLPPNENPGLGNVPTMSDVTSVISAGSSVWTETDPSSKTARRAMIIKMARERMKTVQKEDSQSDSKTFSKSGGIDFSRDLD